MLYRIDGNAVENVPSTKALDEGLYEDDVENWVEQRPDILGEELLVIGRQVQLDEGRDRIDLLAIDGPGNLVVIELKRDLIGGDADLQSLRYGALVSRWTYDEVERQAEGYWRTTGQNRGTFAQEVEAFCDDGYEINAEQRVILAGREVKPRLGTMSMWLRAQGVDLRVVSIDLFRDDDRIYLQPQVVIPPPSEERFQGTGTVVSSDKPWLQQGERWHLEQRASDHGRRIIEAAVELVGAAVADADGPMWTQKFYISWKSGNKTWARLHTLPNVAHLEVKGASLTPDDAAAQLGWEVFDGDAALADKLSLGSNVGLYPDGALRLIIKSAEDLGGEARLVLTKFLREAWTGFTGEPLSDAADDEEEASIAVAVAPAASEASRDGQLEPTTVS